jgi:hypothetical protein
MIGLWKSQNTVNKSLPGEGCNLDFLEEDLCFRCMLRHSVTDSWCWTQVSFPVMMQFRKLSLLWLHHSERLQQTIFEHFYPLIYTSAEQCAVSILRSQKVGTSAPLTPSAHKNLKTPLCFSLVQTERHTDMFTSPQLITQWWTESTKSRSINQNTVYNARRSQQPTNYHYPTNKKVWKLFEAPSYDEACICFCIQI